jgi:hypothetical protein
MGGYLGGNRSHNGMRHNRLPSCHPTQIAATVLTDAGQRSNRTDHMPGNVV